MKVELYPAQKLNFVHALYLTKQQKQKKQTKKIPLEAISMLKNSISPFVPWIFPVTTVDSNGHD